MRPKFPAVSDEMRRRSVMLEHEARTWPGTRCGKMFGMVSLYRKDAIFALLPATRAIENPNSIALRRQKRVADNTHKWEVFPVASDKDLGAALERLRRAYEAAG
jgi:hypothetical protein